MRILHISDIHYCESKQDEFVEYRDRILEELQKINLTKRIDLVLLTGDLLNQHGKNFTSKKDRCYKVFQEEFINPLLQEIDLLPNRLLFIPGNHDVENVDEEDIVEKGLINSSIKKINNLVSTSLRKDFELANERIRKYKEFENEYYNNHKNCQLSNFESCWIEEFDGVKIGIAGLNSAWRCSTKLPSGKLMIGAEKQLMSAKRFFESHKTDFNIAMLHHPIELIAEEERPEIEKYLHDAKISLLIGGHTHRISAYQKTHQQFNLFQTLARIGFTDKREKDEVYQAGFSILDLAGDIFDPEYLIIKCQFYKYVNSTLGFDMDVLGGKGGKASYSIPTKNNSAKFLQLLKNGESASTKSELIIEAHRKAKEELNALWNVLTVSLIRSSFTGISEKLAKNIKKTMLLDNQQFYNTNNVFTYSVNDFDEDHFELSELSEFTINTDYDSINFTRTFVVEKFKGDEDKSDIIIDKLLIDGADYSSSVIALPPEESLDPRTIKIQKSFTINLQSQKRYNVQMITKSIHVHALNGYWRKYFSEITEGVTVNPPINSHYEIDTLNFAKGMDIQKGFIPLASNSSDEPVLFMPGDGFALILKKKLYNEIH